MPLENFHSQESDPEVEVFHTKEEAPKSEEYPALDEVFEQYEQEGRIQHGEIPGSVYTRIWTRSRELYPEMSLAMFNKYVSDRRKLHIVGYRSSREVSTVRNIGSTSIRKPLRPLSSNLRKLSGKDLQSGEKPDDNT